MSEAAQIFDRLIEGASRIARLGEIRRMKAEADATDRRECGNCCHWMKSSDCPRERNVNGRSRGPSMSEPACSNFALEPWVADLKTKRLAAAEAALAALSK